MLGLWEPRVTDGFPGQPLLLCCVRRGGRYMTDKRLVALSDICVLWNKRQLESKEAMHRIWKLFKIENLEAWRKDYVKKQMR